MRPAHDPVQQGLCGRHAACEAHTHNCVASLRSALSTTEAALQAQTQALADTRVVAHEQLAAKEAEVQELKKGLREQGDKLEALVALLQRAVGDHHGLQRALLETGAVLADSRRRGGRPGPPAEPEQATATCSHLGCEHVYAVGKNHGLACRFHPGQLRMRVSGY